jgi:shikimate dehydrogenase
MGYNTDCSGFAVSFRQKLGDAPRRRVVLLGAGGGGSAVAHAVMSLRVEQLFIVDRDHGRAETLARNVAGHYPGRVVAPADELASAAKRADGLIHATPTGMVGYTGLAFDPSLLRPGMWVVEIVYFPLETELLRAARKRGCRTVDGGGMMVWQAVGAFEHFTGIKPDAARMEAHFLKMVSRAGGVNTQLLTIAPLPIRLTPRSLEHPAGGLFRSKVFDRTRNIRDKRCAYWCCMART